MINRTSDDAVSWIRQGKGVSWCSPPPPPPSARTAGLVSGERKSSYSGTRPEGNCVVVCEVIRHA